MGGRGCKIKKNHPVSRAVMLWEVGVSDSYYRHAGGFIFCSPKILRMIFNLIFIRLRYEQSGFSSCLSPHRAVIITDAADWNKFILQRSIIALVGKLAGGTRGVPA